MSIELKPCPFCGCELEKKHIHYVAVGNKAVDYDLWVHPMNDCILDICISLEENFAVRENDIPAWNSRENDEH